MPHTKCDLNVIQFPNGQIWSVVYSGANKAQCSAALNTPSGLQAWAVDALRRSAGNKLAKCALEQGTHKVIKHMADLSMIDAHALRLRILRQQMAKDSTMVLNNVSRLQTDFNKLVDLLDCVEA